MSYHVDIYSILEFNMNQIGSIEREQNDAG